MSLKTVWRWGTSLALCGACAQSTGEKLGPPDAAEPPACDGAADCDDGLFCNGPEQCLQGRCVAGRAPRCDDAIACTRDGCTELLGCVHEPLTQPDCAPRLDASVPALDAGQRDAAQHTEGGALEHPADPARAPDVACASSVGFVVADSQEQLARYGQIDCVAGSVRLGIPLTDLSSLSQLRRVGGDFTFAGSARALDALQALERIDGKVTLGERDAAAGYDLPSLRWVGGDLIVLAPLAVGGLGALRYVGGTLNISAQPSNPNRPVLANLEQLGALQLRGALPEGLPALRSLAGSISRSGAEQASLEPFPKLRTLGGDLFLAATSLREVTLPALERVGRRLYVEQNAQLTRLDLPRLVQAGSLQIRLNPRLSRCEVDGLTGRVLLDPAQLPLSCCNLGCAQCDGPVCKQFGSATAGQSTRFEGGFALGGSAPVDCLSAVEEADELEIGGPGELPASLPLKSVRWLHISETDWQDLSALSSLRSVFQLRIVNNAALTSLHGLEQIGGLEAGLTISGNAVLRDVSALLRAKPWSFGASSSLRDNPALDQCQLDALAPDAGVTAYNNLTCSGTCVAGRCASDSALSP